MSLDDAALLRRWTARREAEAFNEIVERFADQVYRTCHRVLRNEADAEEVSQECFLQLVTAGGDVRTSLGGWLHAVATNKSRERIRLDANRRARERAYGVLAPDPVQPAWDDVRGHVDEAIEALPEVLRDAVVAHYLGRKSHVEIAAEFGVTRRAVSYRIQRGLEGIRKDLRKRGVTLSVASLGMSLALDTSAAPLSLKASLVKLAIAAGTVSGGGGATATGVTLGSLLLMKTKILTVSGILTLLAAGAYFALARTAAEAPGGGAGPEPADSSGMVETAGAPAGPPAPAPAAVVAAVGETPSLDDLLALSRGELEKALEHYPPIADPAQYASVSGMVLDKDAYPVRGAAIALVPSHAWGKLPGAGGIARTGTSGADGVYLIGGIRHEGGFRVAASRDGFASEAKYAAVEAGKETVLDFMLQRGAAMHGRVLSASGAPVPDAYVYCIGLTGARKLVSDLQRAANTDGEGHFTLGFEEEERGFVAALRVRSAEHGSATFPDVLVQTERPVDLKLAAPAVIRGTVKDRKGKALSGARVTFYAQKTIGVQRADGEAWSSPSYAGNFAGISDASGRYATEVDAGMDFQAKVDMNGFDDGRERMDPIAALAAGETREYHAVFDTNCITVRATVVGQQSGQPFSGHVPVEGVAFKDDEPIARGQQDGRLALRFTLPGERGKYTFQARYLYDDDITGNVSAPQKLRGGDEIDIELTLPEPQVFSVRILDPGGSPVEGAAIKFSTETWGGGPVAYGQTNAGGRLDAPILLAPMSGAQLLVEKPGYAMAFGPDFEEQSPGTVHPEETIVLWQGAGIEGDLVDGEGRPVAETALAITATNRDGHTWMLEAITNARGHFTVAGSAPADVVDISISAGDWAWSAEQVALEADTIAGLGEIVLGREP
ncbi:MAG: sigma-70 family RNA polymerase sigma factor [Candidatus Hydrogenedentes bacterium]|nr:sigma-70 family RNA polymerase sigma factor [Candidatus Hydrogenedentota bacterium]